MLNLFRKQMNNKNRLIQEYNIFLYLHFKNLAFKYDSE